MTDYHLLKLVHILSATLLFGTGLGSAFFMFRAWRIGDPVVLHATARSVVIADWLFTTPAVVVQMLTGLWLVDLLGVSWRTSWFIVVIGLYVFVGLCWLPVVRIQIIVRDRAAIGASADCDRLMRVWTALGVLAFTAVLAIFGLMVFKPGIV
jgi:uncharacterized membrane protein